MSEPSWQDLYDIGKTTLQTRRPKARVIEGDVYDCIIAGCASVGVAILARDAQQFRANFLDGAEGEDLTDLAHDRGVDRDPGAAARGTVNLRRPTAGLGAGTISAGTRFATEADETGAFATYTNDEDVVYGALTTDMDLVTITCTKIGKIGNVEAADITRILDPIFDPSIVLHTASLETDQMIAGGEEEESDEDLRDRTRGFYLTQARGTLDAIIFGAKEVPGVTRVSVSVDDAGVITVFVADSDGNSTDTMVDDVTAELEHWRDAADVVYVTGGVIVLQAISLGLTVRTGTSIASLLTRIRAAVVSAVGRLQPGETLYRDMITSAVRAVDPLNITGVTLATPAVNIVPAENELIRTNNGLIDFDA